jgi:ActR/RegA family two-component response regulator
MMSTGKRSYAVTSRAMKLRACDYLVKPVEGDEVLFAVRRWVERPL